MLIGRDPLLFGSHSPTSAGGCSERRAYFADNLPFGNHRLRKGAHQDFTYTKLACAGHRASKRYRFLCHSASKTRRNISPVCAACLRLINNISGRSEEHTSELQSPYVISYAVFCLKKK